MSFGNGEDPIHTSAAVTRAFISSAMRSQKGSLSSESLRDTSLETAEDEIMAEDDEENDEEVAVLVAWQAWRLRLIGGQSSADGTLTLCGGGAQGCHQKTGCYLASIRAGPFGCWCVPAPGRPPAFSACFAAMRR